jgi:hypothetical protein
MRRQATLFVLLGVFALAGCGGGDEGPEWGGYTEEEARNVLASDEYRIGIIQVTPFDGKGRPYEELLPTEEELEAEDLNRRTVDGEEVWEYVNEKEEFCLYVRRDPDSPADYITNVGPCQAD